MAANDPQEMDDFLLNSLGVNNANMRSRIRNQGLGNMDIVLRKTPEYATKVCNVVRKSTGGAAASKDVSVNVEEGMIGFRSSRICHIIITVAF